MIETSDLYESARRNLRILVEKLRSEHAARAIKGTTTVGMRFRDFVVLAADKRATAGHIVAHKNVKKILRVNDRAAVTTAGLVADAQALVDTVRTEARYYELSVGKPMKLRSMASLLGLLLNSSKYYPYIVQLILGGYDYEEGPKVFAIELYGDVTEEDYTATGSGSPIAIGVIESSYRKDLSVEEAVELAVKAVASATMRDVFSGEGIDVAIISRDRFEERTYRAKDIERVLRRSPP